MPKYNEDRAVTFSLPKMFRWLGKGGKKTVDVIESGLCAFHEKHLIPFLIEHPGISQTCTILEAPHSVAWLQRKVIVDKALREKGLLPPLSHDHDDASDE